MPFLPPNQQRQSTEGLGGTVKSEKSDGNVGCGWYSSLLADPSRLAWFEGWRPTSAQSAECKLDIHQMHKMNGATDFSIAMMTAPQTLSLVLWL